MTIPTRKTRLFTRSDVRREDFIDKLRERWTVERAVVTLYELALVRLGPVEELAGARLQLERFRGQEWRHAELLSQLLSELGRDPQRQSPSPTVNVAAADMATLLELLRRRDLLPRHVLQVLLLAERADGAGWALLTELGKEAELDEDYLRSFRAAGREEAEHDHVLREHLLRAERAELFAGQPRTP
jgi:hypothetical protein